MCRIYYSKDGDYVRLCSRTGRQGVRVYFTGDPPELDGVIGKSAHCMTENLPDERPGEREEARIRTNKRKYYTLPANTEE